VPCVVTVVFALSGVDDVGGGADVVGVSDVPPVGPPADVDGGGADVDGAMAAGGAWAAAFCTGGPGSNRQTAMKPAIDSATTKMVLFKTSP